MTSIEITVRKVGDAYKTDVVDGKQGASSTSPARAAERLAEHLWGVTDLDTARRIGPRDPKRPFVTRWRITDEALSRRSSHV